jgi:hypothetical protein
MRVPVRACGDTSGARRLLLGFREKRTADVGLNLNLGNLAFDEAEAFASANGHRPTWPCAQRRHSATPFRREDAAYPGLLLQVVERELARTGTAPPALTERAF